MILLTNTIYYRTDKYCVNVKAKTRYVIPLVITKGKADRIVDISTKSKEKIDKYQIEPYVLSENISAAEAFLGQGSFSWLTGASSWFYRIGIEEILGFHKNGNILKLEPKIPIAWDNFKLTYKYLNTTYKIEVIKSEKEALEIDGKNQISNKIELTDDKKVHKINLFIKK